MSFLLGRILPDNLGLSRGNSLHCFPISCDCPAELAWNKYEAEVFYSNPIGLRGSDQRLLNCVDDSEQVLEQHHLNRYVVGFGAIDSGHGWSTRKAPSSNVFLYDTLWWVIVCERKISGDKFDSSTIELNFGAE